MIHESVESKSVYFDTLKMPVLGVNNRTFTDIAFHLKSSVIGQDKRFVRNVPFSSLT